jgi:hypothetical protein
MLHRLAGKTKKNCKLRWEAFQREREYYLPAIDIIFISLGDCKINCVKG